jgi:hypothetical protein
VFLVDEWASVRDVPPPTRYCIPCDQDLRASDLPLHRGKGHAVAWVIEGQVPSDTTMNPNDHQGDDEEEDKLLFTETISTLETAKPSPDPDWYATPRRHVQKPHHPATAATCGPREQCPTCHHVMMKWLALKAGHGEQRE